MADLNVDYVGSRGTGRLVPRSRLFEVLTAGERVIVVSAPAGSGKTFLLRSWIAQMDLAERAAWVSVGREERDPQAFWLSVLHALRATRAGSAVLSELAAAPHLASSSSVSRLIGELTALDEPLWLVIDDLHELKAEEAIRQLEVLIKGAPGKLRFVVLTRHDLALGFHRLRLEGELTDIRGQDLRFTADESKALLDAAGVALSESAIEAVVGTTEGWAAGLRLAALSMARDPDPERFAASFSGRERAVAEYLLAEVLERQPPEVTRLLLRTSILERVSGPLADRLTGNSGAERILVELEDAGAFVVALDPERSWFRYHHLFADLLVLELRRTAPEQLPELHTTAAEWFAEHGYPVTAIRHAQTAGNWGLAARLLVDNHRALYLEGRLATGRELLSRFPAEVVAGDAELAMLAAGHKRAAGSLHEAEQYLKLATSMSASVPEDRQRRFQVGLVLVRLALGRARNDLQAVADESQRLIAAAEAPEGIEFGLGQDLRTTALADLGIAEMWAGELDAAERHLELALTEARQIGMPLLELQALAHSALLNLFRAQAIGEERARQAIDLARAHGCEETASSAATAYLVLASATLWRGHLDEAERWLERADLVLGRFAQPTMAMTMHVARAVLEFARGRHEAAMTALRETESIQRALATRHILATSAQAVNLGMLVHLGKIEPVQRALDEMDEDLRATVEMRIVLATLRLAQEDPDGATEALAPIFHGPSPLGNPRWKIPALLLKARAHDALGDAGATSRALEHALDLAEPVGLLLPFLLVPARELLERHSRFQTSHASLISEILDLLSGHTPAARPEDTEPLQEPLSESELRVLRHLPTNLQAPEIAAELYVSVNTVRTHTHHLYVKLGVHSRADAVQRARALGLLSPSLRQN